MRLQLGNRLLGDLEPTLLVAEIGLNHNGSIVTALEMVRAAAKAGADAVKVQAFTAASFCTEKATYQGERQIDLFRRYELGAVHLSEIADECKRQGLLFFGTPDSVDQARLLVALGSPCLKVGSDDLVHLPLLRQLAKFGLPMILSTGMATADEVGDALDATSSVPVVLLHCVSSYPTPAADVNMRRMRALRSERRLVGYSDHTFGIEAAVGAVWAGACLIEKHFTLSQKSTGPDHAFSADPEQFHALARQVRLVETMLGDGIVAPTEAEEKMRVIARRSIVAAGPIAAGDTFTADILEYKRPGNGLPPATADVILGKRATRALVWDEQLREGDWR